MDILNLLNDQKNSPQQHQQRRSSPYVPRGFNIYHPVMMDRRADEVDISRQPLYNAAARYSPHSIPQLGAYATPDSEYGTMSYTSSPMGASPHSSNGQYEHMMPQAKTSHPSPSASNGPVRSNRGSPSGGEGSAPKAFACSTCSKGFARRSDLVRHERIHSGVRPHACPHPGCDKQFIQRSALTVHERVHTGEKPHSCEKCGKPFSDSSSLARHRRIHLGTRPYKCDHPGCHKTFTRRTTLTRHMSHHSGAMSDASGGRGSTLTSQGSHGYDMADHSDSSSSGHSRSMHHQSNGSISSLSRTPSYHLGAQPQTFFPGPHMGGPHMAAPIPDHPNMPPSPARSHSTPYEQPKQQFRHNMISPPNSYGAPEPSPTPMQNQIAMPDNNTYNYPGMMYYQTADPVRSQALYAAGAFETQPQASTGVAAWATTM